MTDVLFETYEPEELALAGQIRAWSDQALAPIDPITIAHEVAVRSALAGRPGRIAGGVMPALRGRRLVLVPWWLLVCMTLLAAIAIGGALLSAGSRAPKLPPPFGPARNGVLVVGAGLNAFGPILQVDPVTGVAVELVDGQFFGPTFSNDGRRVLFTEPVGQVNSGLWVMNADGSDVHQLVPQGVNAEPIWAPDSHRIYYGNGHWLVRYDVDNDASVRYDVGIDVGDIRWRPNHDQLVLNGTYLVNMDGTDLRPISQLDITDGVGPISPDGSLIAYSAGEPGSVHREPGSVHLVDIDTGVDRELTFEGSEGTSESPEAFSPDGARLLIKRSLLGKNVAPPNFPYCCREPWLHVVVPVAGGGPAIILGSAEHRSIGGPGGGGIFSPDGTQVLAAYSQEPLGAWLFDAVTGQGVPLPWPDGWGHQGITWQRVAP